MPRIYLCFLWHMHQPFYKDLLSGEYKLPWTRMHALKDYYGMVRILEEFPKIRQTFNLVPSMMVQVEEYAAGKARDPFLDLALKPAEALTIQEQQFIVKHFFHAHPGRMIYRYPRYGELFSAWNAQRNNGAGAQVFSPQDFRDLQMLSQLAWFDEEFQEHDGETIDLIRKGRNYSPEDQARMGEKQRELVSAVIPEYKKLAAAKQIEISTTPYYHPILPLLCDSDIAGVSHPHVPLPKRFRYPEDARLQLEMAREYIGRVFGVEPLGLWPSEGSVSDEAFALAADCGFEWAATDNGILDRTLGYGAGVENTYRPWIWNQGGRAMKLIFRDHLLSDLIGFVYSGMNSRDAAHDFLHRIRGNCQALMRTGRDALVPIILDGENAWEYYDRNGRPFFRELYRAISDDAQMEAITVSEAFQRLEPGKLERIFPGSWINSNFDVWIGAEEDNRAWNFLLAARQEYEAATAITPDRRKLAYEELLIAEGSDWCWWYGPEHDSANREEFDQLFRGHIANVYRALGKTPPQDLSRPILRIVVEESQTSPTGLIRACIDGRVTSYFEWLGAGIYRVNPRSGSMHGKRVAAKQIQYGTDGSLIFLRIDFQDDAQDLLNGADIRVCVRAVGDKNGNSKVDGDHEYSIHLENGLVAGSHGPRPVQASLHQVLELGIEAPPGGEDVQFQLSFWHDGLPVDAVPAQGWITLSLSDPAWSL